MNPFASKEPWEMTKEEWDAERERIRSSSSGEHRKSLYNSANRGKQWQAHFDWLTMGLPGQWMRFHGDEPYRSSVQPKPEDDDYDDAFQVPISYEMVVEQHKKGSS